MKYFQKKTTINPKLKSTYRLWSFQSLTSIEELKTKGIIEARWDRYSESNQFIKPYKWMWRQMIQRGINCQNNPPVWAWHSCKFYEKAPTLTDARCLLSDKELEDGIQTVEFECPVELVLLSGYGMWNSMLHEFFPYADDAILDEKTEKILFETTARKFRRSDSIQAALPYLKMEWVNDIRDLRLKPNNFNYSHEQSV